MRLLVMLESSGGSMQVRDECVALLRPAADDPHLAWHADQYTQETIGTTLALEGWEAISLAQQGGNRAPIDPATVTYVVRRV
jgi:hypothetical protein